MASLSKSTSAAATRTPFWETWLGKSVTASLNCSETSGTPWIRHSDLAGNIVLFLANTEHDFKCCTLAENRGISSPPVRISFFSRSTVKLNFLRKSRPRIQGSVTSAT
ncbi:hypothetical protein AVEN_247300-1 [Araneus ventricosus]|uniref:Uncharacterized protein n=1 Tax=Araneus ventricosus TaxID=182803 RepID=A0A4Y2J3B4_ARAVE|nr:hypothetical protein AVEN_247300-1 [Araneus ventricosus]